MLRTYDVGSLPLRVEESTIWEGARKSQTVLSLVGVSDEASRVFESEVVGAFIDKVKTGLDISNYPQFRDMNEMFFEKMRGFEKGGGGYASLGTISAKAGASIPEVDVIKRNMSKIRDDAGVDLIGVKVCVTGPYTLASFFQAKTPSLFRELGGAIAEILSNSMFDTRHGGISMMCIDEPVLGFIDDPLLDYGSEGREALRASWDEICRAATSRGAETSMHLHNTSDDLFWDVERLGIIESHVDDPLYSRATTKSRLEETDKRLKASVAVTLFDNVIEAYLRREGVKEDLQQRIGEIWTEIRHSRVDPVALMEDPVLFGKRLSRVVERFGAERVPYAGPECGFSSWPSYETAMECLRGISKAVDEYNRENP